MENEVHMKNDELYKKVSQYPIRDQIRERQLKLTGHCLRMDKEYQQTRREIKEEANTNYHGQISTHLTNDAKVGLEVDQIARMARDKIGWFQNVVPKKPARCQTKGPKITLGIFAQIIDDMPLR